LSTLLVASIVVAAMVAKLNVRMEVVCQYPVLRGKEKTSPKKLMQRVSTMKMSSAMMA